MKLGLDAYATPTICDDAGVRREVFNPFARGETDPEILDICRRVVQHDQAQHGTALAKVDLHALLPGCLVGVAVFVTMPFIGVIAGGPFSVVLIMIPAMGVLMLVMKRRMRRRTADSIRTTLLGCGRCPACAYAVSVIPPGPEGLIRCPECDASWRPDRFPVALPIPAPVDVPPAPAEEDTPTLRWFSATVITDARGTVRRVGEYRKLPELAPVTREIARLTRPRRVLTTLGWALLFLPVIATQLYSMRWGPVGGATLGSILSYAPLLGGVFFGVMASFRLWASWTGRTLRVAAVAAEVLVRSGRCPACLKDLGETPLPPEASPAAYPVECPHCRALWTRPKDPPRRGPVP